MRLRRIGLSLIGAFVCLAGIEMAHERLFLSIVEYGRAKAIRFTTLSALCKALECQPGDLLEFVEDEDFYLEQGGATLWVYRVIALQTCHSKNPITIK